MIKSVILLKIEAVCGSALATFMRLKSLLLTLGFD
jgi:hypothetical protein